MRDARRARARRSPPIPRPAAAPLVHRDGALVPREPRSALGNRSFTHALMGTPPQPNQAQTFTPTTITGHARPPALRDTVRDVADRLEAFDMPTSALRDVAKRYTLSSGGGDNYTRPGLNRMRLSDQTASGLQSFPLRGGTSGVGTLYHESTHAWLDLHGGEQEVRDISTISRLHYMAAPLSESGISGLATDAERISQEAAAEYLDHRAGAKLSAMSLLSELSSGESGLTAGQRVELLEEQKAAYGTAMARRTFGYQDYRGQQVHTTREIHESVRELLDRRILEGKVHERWEDDPELVDLENEVRRRR
jgi:hypothetical protein